MNRIRRVAFEDEVLWMQMKREFLEFFSRRVLDRVSFERGEFCSWL